MQEKYESPRKNETGGPRPLVFPRALVFFSYFFPYLSRIFLVFLLRALPQQKYEKNTRALGKTRRAALALSFFLELSYFSRIFLVFFPYFSCFFSRILAAGPAPAKIREKYESSRKNETGGPRPLVFPRALVFFSYFSRIFPVFFSYFGCGPAPAKIREKYESSRKNETGGPRPLVFPRALVFFSYFPRIFPVFFSVFWLRARTGKNTRKIREL